MKKSSVIAVVAAAAVLLLSSPEPAHAIDWGGNIENYTMSDTVENGLTQTNRVGIWLSGRLSERSLVKGQASAGYSYDDYNLLLDIDYLYYRTDISALLAENSNTNIRAGRFLQSEFTGKVFSHRLDGLGVTYSLPFMNITAGGGYSGFLLKEASGINVSKADIIDDADDDVMLAPKKMFSMASISFPDILPAQRLDLSLLAHLDQRSSDLIGSGDTSADGNKGGKLNLYYLGTGLSGALFGSSIVYDSFFYYQTGETLSFVDQSVYRYKPVTAFMAGGSIAFVRKTDDTTCMISALLIYSSGDDDCESVYEGNTSGGSTQFIPVTKYERTLIFRPMLSNIIASGIDFSVSQPLASSGKKNADFMATISATSFSKASDGATSVSERYGEDHYLGSELDISLAFRPLSDLGINASYGIFIPNRPENTLSYVDYSPAEIGGSVSLSLSF